MNKKRWEKREKRRKLRGVDGGLGGYRKSEEKDGCREVWRGNDRKEKGRMWVRRVNKSKGEGRRKGSMIGMK